MNDSGRRYRLVSRRANMSGETSRGVRDALMSRINMSATRASGDCNEDHAPFRYPH